MKADKISIIIPNYNRGEDVCQLVRSIRLSSFNKYDITIVDDFSSDNSVEILQQLQIPVIRHKKNRGPSAARNTGAISTSGDILFFIDSDVEIYPDTLEKIYYKFKECPEISAIVAIPGIENLYSDVCSTHFTLRVYYNYFNLPDFITFTCSTAVAVRRAAFNLVNGFNERIIRPSVEDGEFGMEISKKRLKIYLDKNNPVKHNKKINLYGIIRNDINRVISKINSLQFKYRIKESIVEKRYASIPFSQLMSVVIAPSLILLPLFGLLNYWFIFLWFLLLFIFTGIYHKYLRLIVDRKGIYFVIKVYFLLIADMFFVHLAILYGFINLLLKRMRFVNENITLS